MIIARKIFPDFLGEGRHVPSYPPPSSPTSMAGVQRHIAQSSDYGTLWSFCERPLLKELPFGAQCGRRIIASG